jgi:hypothetical protein
MSMYDSNHLDDISQKRSQERWGFDTVKLMANDK